MSHFKHNNLSRPQSIENDEWGSANDEFAYARFAARVSEVRVVAQRFNHGNNTSGHALRRIRLVLRDI